MRRGATSADTVLPCDQWVHFISQGDSLLDLYLGCHPQNLKRKSRSVTYIADEKKIQSTWSASIGSIYAKVKPYLRRKYVCDVAKQIYMGSRLLLWLSSILVLLFFSCLCFALFIKYNHTQTKESLMRIEPREKWTTLYHEYLICRHKSYCLVCYVITRGPKNCKIKCWVYARHL